MLISLTGCSRTLPSYRYRLTVQVDTPQGLREGSSVIEVHTVDQVGFPGPEAGGLNSGMIGEAVAVDLPGKRTLFALLSNAQRSEAALSYAPDAFDSVLTRKLGPLGKKAQWGDWLGELKQQREPAVLPRTLPSGLVDRAITYPLLVGFGEIRNPKTIRLIDPDNLAKDFGPGVRLRNIIVEITDKPVTKGITHRLPWLEYFRLHGGPLSGNELADNVHIEKNVIYSSFVHGSVN